MVLWVKYGGELKPPNESRLFNLKSHTFRCWKLLTTYECLIIDSWCHDIGLEWQNLKWIVFFKTLCCTLASVIGKLTCVYQKGISVAILTVVFFSLSPRRPPLCQRFVVGGKVPDNVAGTLAAILVQLFTQIESVPWRRVDQSLLSPHRANSAHFVSVCEWNCAVEAKARRVCVCVSVSVWVWQWRGKLAWVNCPIWMFVSIQGLFPKS